MPGTDASKPKRDGPLLCALAAAAAGFGAALAVAAAAGFPWGGLLRDAAATTAAHPLTGAVATAGGLGWAAAATLALLGAAAGRPGRGRAFLLAVGLGTLWLGLDDLFLVHEDLAYRWFGVRETGVLGVYALVFGFTAWWFRDLAGLGGRGALRATAGLLALSVAGDALPLDVEAGWTHAAEDGPKLLGIAAWIVYCGRATLRVVREDPAAAQAA